jgi:hypothetical protein
VRRKKQNWDMIYKSSMSKFVLKQLVVDKPNKCHFGEPRWHLFGLVLMPWVFCKRYFNKKMKNLKSNHHQFVVL